MLRNPIFCMLIQHPFSGVYNDIVIVRISHVSKLLLKLLQMLVLLIIQETLLFHKENMCVQSSPDCYLEVQSQKYTNGHKWLQLVTYVDHWCTFTFK